jgi:hypothetical protein
MVNYNSTTRATCLLELTTYKHNELQVFGAIQKLSCKVNCKTFIFLMVFFIKEKKRKNKQKNRKHKLNSQKNVVKCQ